MKIYTMLSKSHQFLYDEFFYKSIKENEPEAEIVLGKQDQICKSGNYYEDGWKESMRQKVEIYSEAINSGDNMFIWSDVDIEFYEPFIQQCIKELGDFDIAFQEGVGDEYCAGFFIAKINDRTKKFFNILKNKYENYSCDQDAINKNIQLVKAKFLSRKFLNVSFQHRHWDGQEVVITEPISMFHANYTVGLQRKIMLLKSIKQNNERLKKQLANNPNIKILEAYYGILEDVTQRVIEHKQKELKVNTENLKCDPAPGVIKFLYLFDDKDKILNQAIKEDDFIQFND